MDEIEEAKLLIAEQDKKDLQNAGDEFMAALEAIGKKYGVKAVIKGQFFDGQISTGVQFIKNGN